MKAAWALVAVVAAMAALSSPAHAANPCPGLAAALDDSVAWASRALADDSFFPIPDNSLPVWLPYPSGAALRQGADCWKQRAAAPVDNDTRASVIRTSSLALSIARWNGDDARWGYLREAYVIERMVGVVGPVTRHLSRDDAYFVEIDGKLQAVLWTRNTALNVLQLSALCRAVKGNLGPTLAGGGYTVDPEVGVSWPGGDDPYDQFMEAERVRTLEECSLT